VAVTDAVREVVDAAAPETIEASLATEVVSGHVAEGDDDEWPATGLDAKARIPSAAAAGLDGMA